MTSVGQLRPGNPRMHSKQCERNERASLRGTVIHFSGRKSEPIFRGLQLQRSRDSPLLPHSRPGPETPHSFLHHSLLLHPHDCKRQQTLHGSFTAINHPDRQARMGPTGLWVSRPSPARGLAIISAVLLRLTESLQALPTTLTGCPRQLKPLPLHIFMGKPRQGCLEPILEAVVVLGQERVKITASLLQPPGVPPTSDAAEAQIPAATLPVVYDP